MNLSTLPQQRRALLAINGHCLAATTCACLSWWLWPTSPEWWQFAILSLLLGLQAVLSLVAAIKAFIGYVARERAVTAFAAQGAAAKSAVMASHRALVDAGMVDDDA